MVSTYSTSLLLELMATGDQSGTWGVTTNSNLGTLLEQAITGVLSKAMADADVTLTDLNGASDEARNAVLVMTGANTAVRKVIVPSGAGRNKLYLVQNSTTGGFAVNVITAAGTGVLVPPGQSRWVYCDGTNVNSGLVGYQTESFTTTATAAGTTTLTATSTFVQQFTGTLAQTVQLPAVSTLFLGKSYLIINDSVVPITVTSSGANTVQQIPAGQRALVVCLATSGTGATAWDMNSYGSGRRARRNRLVNPAFQISQEHGTTGGTTTGYFAADQWQHFFVSSAGTFTVAQVAAVSPQGSQYRMRETITVADASLAAGEYLILTQNVEGNEVADFQWGGASAKPCVVRFGFKAPAGTYSVSVQNAALARSYVAQFTVTSANTDVYYSVAIPGDTTGTWNKDTSLGLTLNVVLAAGATFQTTVGAWQAGNYLGTSSNTNGMASNTNVFELFDAQLHLDVDNTGVAPGWELPEYGQVLRDCQRFYQTSYTYGTAPGSVCLAAGNVIAAAANCVPLIGLSAGSGLRSSADAALTVPLRAAVGLIYWDLGGNATRVTVADNNSNASVNNDNTDSFRSFVVTANGVSGHNAPPASYYYWAINYSASGRY